MAGGASEDAIEALLVPARRRPVVALIALCSLMFVVGVAAAVPMARPGGVEAGGPAPGAERDARVRGQGLLAGPAMEPSTTTSTPKPDAPLAPVGAAEPDADAARAPGDEGPTTSTTPASTTTTTAPAPSPWRTSSPSPLGARRGHEAVWTPHGMVVLGGDAGGPLTGAVYWPGDDTWRTLSAAPFPEGDWRDAAVGAAWDGSAVHVVATTAPTGGSMATYEPATDTWTTITDPLPEGTSTGGVVAWTGTRLLVVGGSGDDPAESGRVTLAYTPGSGWARLPDAPFTVDEGQGGDRAVQHVWTPHGLLVWDDSATGAILRRSDDGVWSWTTLDAAPFAAPLDQAAVAWTGTHVVWLFGVQADGARPAAAAAFNPVTGTWETLDPGDLGGRRGAVAVGTGGSSVFVCCGEAISRADRGALVDASSGAWTSAPGYDGLAAHGAGATAVWSGSQVVVWGGAATGGSATATLFTP